MDHKKIIVVTGRVHPGEANSSHMIKGLIDRLLAPNKEAEELRKFNHIFVIPMINPDGVVLGNTRTSAAGKDLNREFFETQKQLFPQCNHIKTFVSQLQKRGRVAVYLDFHGHSRRKSTFLFGPDYSIQHAQYYKSRILPKVIERINPIFRYYGCNFVIPESKKSTARAIMLHQLLIPYVYTVESSIGLYFDPQIKKTLPFSVENWQMMGSNILEGLSEFMKVIKIFDNHSKERRGDRLPRRERSFTISGSRVSRKISEEFQFQSLMGQNTKDQNIVACVDILREIKIQLKNSKLGKDKCIANQDDSDDHDSEQDLPAHKMKQFKSMVVKTRYKSDHKETRTQIFREGALFTSPLANPTKIKEIIRPRIKQAANGTNIDSSNNRVLSQSKLLMNSTKTIQLQRTRIHKTKFLNNRRSVYQGIPSVHSESKANLKKQVAEKIRFASINKNLFPTEKKEETERLSKDLQILKKQMTKGRLLISSLEEKRNKFSSEGSSKMNQEEMNKNKKGPFFPHDPSKIRMAARSSTFYLLHNRNLQRQQNNQFRDFQEEYSPLQGLQVDNLAMTITAFKMRP